MGKQEYEVQRKYIAWETTLVEANSFDEAIDIAEEEGGWFDAPDSYEATADYWVNNRDTDVAKIRREFTGWEDSI